MSLSYKKIVYVWNEPRGLVDVPKRLTYQSVDASNQAEFMDMVSQVMSTSVDKNDQKAVELHGAKATAERFVKEAPDHFVVNHAWWQIAYNGTTSIGFVQPVLYPDSQKDDLEEATIYYIGVLPEYRGHNYAYDLLCKATRLMQEFGVWRIYCDTDVDNIAMINTFRRVGYKQDGEPKEITLRNYPLTVGK